MPGEKPSNISFGGPDGRTAYVTEVVQGRLLQFRVDRPGLEWQRGQERKANPLAVPSISNADGVDVARGHDPTGSDATRPVTFYGGITRSAFNRSNKLKNASGVSW